jgi:hypothetical protein
MLKKTKHILFFVCLFKDLDDAFERIKISQEYSERELRTVPPEVGRKDMWPCGPHIRLVSLVGLSCWPLLSILLIGALFLSRGWETVRRVVLGRCLVPTAGSNCADLHRTWAGKGMFWGICIIFLTLNPVCYPSRQ